VNAVTDPAGRPAVQVCVSIGTTQVVPNLLPFVIDLTGETLTACVTTNVE
jgi:hypothetical protein